MLIIIKLGIHITQPPPTGCGPVMDEYGFGVICTAC